MDHGVDNTRVVAAILDAQSESQLDYAVDLLRRGLPVGVPTETVYGLAAPAMDHKALARIFTLKNRPKFDPLIVHISDRTLLPSLVERVTPLHRDLMDAFWPGPLTLLFEKSEHVSDLCTAGTPWVAIRQPHHEVFSKLIRKIAQPLAAPSANRFGRISPTSARHVVHELGPFGLQAVVDGGECLHGIESTVVKILSDKHIEIVRLGACALEKLGAVLGKGIEISVRESGSGQVNAIIQTNGQGHESPGQLQTHYAPQMPAYLWRPDLKVSPQESVLLSVFEPSAIVKALPWKEQHMLSASGSDREAAVRLFEVLRELDAKFHPIVIELPPKPHTGLLPAVCDRLTRAATG